MEAEMMTKESNKLSGGDRKEGSIKVLKSFVLKVLHFKYVSK
jgi:hypothetical protein